MLSSRHHAGLITRTMKLAVMDPTDRDRELVAHSTSECTRLRKGEVMRIRRYAAAHQARLPHHELPVVFIAQANRFAQRTHCTSARALRGGRWSLLAADGIDQTGRHHTLVRDSVSGIAICPARERTVRRPSRVFTQPARIPAATDTTEPRLKPLLDNFGVCGCQRVLGREIPMRPAGRLVLRSLWPPFAGADFREGSPIAALRGRT